MLVRKIEWEQLAFGENSAFPARFYSVSRYVK
jgi:hypothetical protein